MLVKSAGNGCGPRRNARKYVPDMPTTYCSVLGGVNLYTFMPEAPSAETTKISPLMTPMSIWTGKPTRAVFATSVRLPLVSLISAQCSEESPGVAPTRMCLS